MFAPHAASALLMAASLGCRSPSSRAVAITIDDLPIATFELHGSDEARLAVVRGVCAQIEAARVPVTGFVNMVHHEKQPALMSSWRSCGLSFGNHGFAHAHFDRVGLEAFTEDMAKGREHLQAWLASDRGLFFRYPYLAEGFEPAAHDAAKAQLRAWGDRLAPVTIDTSDWLYAAGYTRARLAGRSEEAKRYARGWALDLQEATLSAEALSRELFAREPPQVVLLHANALAAEQLHLYLEWLRARGYRFITLAEALEDPAYDEAVTRLAPTGESHWVRLRRSRATGSELFPMLPAD